jgi:hypothetical protein
LFAIVRFFIFQNLIYVVSVFKKKVMNNI